MKSHISSKNKSFNKRIDNTLSTKIKNDCENKLLQNLK